MINFIKNALAVVMAYAIGVAAGLVVSYGILILLYGTAFILKG